MTKVLKLLGGGLLAAILGIALSAAAFGLFSNDNGTSIAAPTFDRASAHVSLGAADLAPAKSVAVPIRYLPGDINATSLTAYDADTSNPLNAFPVGLARAVDSLTAASLPFYDSLSPGASDLPTASGANDPNAKGIINASYIKEVLGSYYMKINTINVSRAPASDLVNNVDFLNDSTGHPNSYTLNSRWSLITSAGASGNSFSFVKGTDISGKIPDATNNAIVTAIYGRDDTSKQYTQILPPGVNVLGATTKMTLSTGQAYWIKTTIDPSAKGIRFGNLSWADTVDRYTAAVQHARGDSVQISEPFIPAVAAGGGLVLNNDNMYTNALDPAICAGSCQLHAMDATTATRTDAGINALGSQVGIGTITAPADNSKTTALDRKWNQAVAEAPLANSPFLVLGIVLLFVAVGAAKWNPEAFSTRNQHARALGAG